MRLVRAFIAILLTASLVVAPAAVLPALAAAGNHLAMTFQGAEESTGAATPSHEGQAVEQASDADDHSAHHSAPHEPASCCKLACHAFGLALGPVVFVPLASVPVLNVSVDEQVTGTYLGRIDRPPRPL